MKKYFAPELETAKFLAADVIAVSPAYNAARIIGGDDPADNEGTQNTYNGIVTFDWEDTDWD